MPGATRIAARRRRARCPAAPARQAAARARMYRDLVLDSAERVFRARGYHASPHGGGRRRGGRLALHGLRRLRQQARALRGAARDARARVPGAASSRRCAADEPALVCLRRAVESLRRLPGRSTATTCASTCARVARGRSATCETSRTFQAGIELWTRLVRARDPGGGLLRRRPPPDGDHGFRHHAGAARLPARGAASGRRSRRSANASRVSSSARSASADGRAAQRPEHPEEDVMSDPRIVFTDANLVDGKRPGAAGLPAWWCRASASSGRDGHASRRAPATASSRSAAAR